jgi:hypothetical protein
MTPIETAIGRVVDATFETVDAATAIQVVSNGCKVIIDVRMVILVGQTITIVRRRRSRREDLDIVIGLSTEQSRRERTEKFATLARQSSYGASAIVCTAAIAMATSGDATDDRIAIFAYNTELIVSIIRTPL